MVFQSYALYPNMTVGQNIAFGLEMRGVPKAERDKADGARSRSCCRSTTCSTASPASSPAASASASPWAGRWCATRKLFLFDEPLSNLDAKLRVEMRTEIKKLHQRLKATIVYVTHDQIEAMTLATRIAVMKAGELQQFGTPQEIYEQPGQPVRRRLHGLAVDEPDPGQAGRGQWRPRRSRSTRAEGGPAMLPLAQRQRRLARPMPAATSILGLRPEQISDPTNTEALGPDQHPSTAWSRSPSPPARTRWR